MSSLVIKNKDKEYRMTNKVLGKGTFSIVVEGIDVVNKKAVAIKYPRRPIEDEQRLNLYRKEMVIYYQEMQKIANITNHVEIYDYFICPIKYDNEVIKAPIVVMRKYSKTLKDLLNERARKCMKFKTYEVVVFIRDVLRHLRYLYKQNMFSCKLSPERIFIDVENDGNYEYIMPDFAVNKELKDGILSLASKEVYFDYYSPPEYKPSHKYDIFMLGSILYEMLTFRKYKLDLFHGRVTDETGIFTDLIQQCVDEQADERPSYDRVFCLIRQLILIDLYPKRPLEDNEYYAYLPFCEEELEKLYPKH